MMKTNKNQSLERKKGKYMSRKALNEMSEKIINYRFLSKTKKDKGIVLDGEE